MASSSQNRDIGAVKGGQGLESTPANSSSIFDQVRQSSGSNKNEGGAMSHNEGGGGLLDKAKDKIAQMQDAVKDQMHTGNDPKHMKGHTGGGVTQKAQTSLDNTLQSIGKSIGGNTHGEVGGPQLFKDPVGADESGAGGGFMRKYTNETAPGENTS